LFAIMAQQAGTGTLPLELPAGARLGSVQTLLQERFTGLRWPAGTMLAVNQEYAAADRSLQEGDEVAVIPPVSGG
jgi:molybdopterin converting factor subunit 1